MFRFTNNYSSTVWAMVEWNHANCPDGGDWEKKGRWQMEPGQSAVVFGSGLKDVNRLWYWFAHACDGAVWGGLPGDRPRPRVRLVHEHCRHELAHDRHAGAGRRRGRQTTRSTSLPAEGGYSLRERFERRRTAPTATPTASPSTKDSAITTISGVAVVPTSQWTVTLSVLSAAKRAAIAPAAMPAGRRHAPSFLRAPAGSSVPVDLRSATAPTPPARRGLGVGPPRSCAAARARRGA